LSGDDQSGYELRLLSRIVEEVTAAQDLAEVVHRSLDVAREVARTTSGAIYLRDDRLQRFVRQAAHDTTNEQTYLPTPQIDAWMATRNSQLFDLTDPAASSHPGTLAARAKGFRATLNLAMRWRGRLIGLLVLAFRDRVNVAESTQRTLETLTGFLASAIENARARRQLELRAHLSQTLREFSERALATTDTEALHRLILDAALDLSGDDRGFLAVAGADGSTIVAGAGCCTRLIGQKLPVGDRYLAESMAQAAPLVIDDVQTLDPTMPVAAAALRQQTASLMVLTLRQDDRALGQLLIGAGVARHWEREEVEAMRTLASMGAELLYRAAMQEAAEVERRRLGETIEVLPMAVTVLDAEGRPIQFNAAARAFAASWGLTDTNWHERIDFLLRTPEGQPVALQDAPGLLAFRGQVVPPYDLVLVDPRGERPSRTMRTAAAPLHDRDGKLIGVVIGNHDVTELYALAEAKDRFMRIASHELRSPITSLRATTDLLRIDPSAISDAVRRDAMLQRLDRQSARLLRLVEQLLEATRSGQEVPLQLADVDAVTLCREVQEAAGARVRLDGNGPLRVHWDPLRIEQVLTNLVGNALRYSDDTVILRVRGEGERVRLQVVDQGVGIGPVERSKLFTPFFRGTPASDRYKGGVGLGLYITHEIVRRHGGEIEVESAPGAGSTFTVVLPGRAR
jgi:signal transduction histidine kinase